MYKFINIYKYMFLFLQKNISVASAKISTNSLFICRTSLSCFFTVSLSVNVKISHNPTTPQRNYRSDYQKIVKRKNG